jgi:hypothetical protein
MSNREKFGKPAVGSGPKIRHFRLLDGSNRYRVAPAYGKLAASGKWNLYIKQHWGYYSTGDEQNPNGFPRLFVCPEDVDFKTKIVNHSCPECDKNNALRAQVENREVKLRESGKTDEEIETLLGPSKEYLKKHNLDKKFVVIAKNEKNEWGVLWIPFKAKEALDNRRKQVQKEEGWDILDPDEGAWLDFTRTGQNRNTVYGCDVVKETVALENGKKAKQDKQEALTDTDYDAIVAEVPELDTIGRRLTDEQIERLVESMGDPEIVDAVFNEGREASASVKKEAASVKTRTVKIAEVDGPGPNERTATYKREVVPEDDEEAKLQAQLEAARAKKAAKALAEQAAKAPAPAPASDVTPIVPDDMSDDEFVKAYGKKFA